MKQQSSRFTTILITGASSGIGAALAEYYAAPGKYLILIGRDDGRLQNVVELCKKCGAQVRAQTMDVKDRVALERFIAEEDHKNPIDLVIANAGISAGTGGVLSGEAPDQVRAVFDVNLYGVLNTIEPLRIRMQQRKAGQIAIMSSLAGYRGWPGAPAYCASKAAVRIYGESLRGHLQESGVGVSVICPGFVESRMTAVNEFPMPFLMAADKAVAIIARGLERNRATIAFPAIPMIFSTILLVMPQRLVQNILIKMPKKRQKNEL